jgi:hypothetical protein
MTLILVLDRHAVEAGVHEHQGDGDEQGGEDGEEGALLAGRADAGETASKPKMVVNLPISRGLLGSKSTAREIPYNLAG